MQTKINDTKTERVKRELLKMFVEKGYSPNEMIPSEGAIAELFGVSRMTSKMALNALADEGIIYRVPRQGSFLKDFNFTKINSLLEESDVEIHGQNNIQFIALVIPKIDFYTGQIIAELTQIAGEKNYEVVVKVSGGSLDEEEKLLKEISTISSIRGVIFFPGDKNVCGNELLHYKIQKYPIVMVDRVYKEIEFDSVYHDHYQGAKNIVNYLISKGHRKIGFLSYDISEITSRDERYKGYVSAMTENDIPIKNNYVMIGDFSQDRHEILNYLKNAEKMTAVFCGDDYLAIQIYYAANELGITVPDRLSIAGFSDNAILEYLKIDLTTMRQPVKPLMKEAVDILTNRIQRKEEPIKHIKIPTELIERKSVKDLLP